MLDLLRELVVVAVRIKALAVALETHAGILDTHTAFLRRLYSTYTAPPETVLGARDVASKTATALREHEPDDVEHWETGFDALGRTCIVKGLHERRACANEVVDAGLTIRTELIAAEVEVRDAEALESGGSREHGE
jgi:hypothetical protein